MAHVKCCAQWYSRASRKFGQSSMINIMWGVFQFRFPKNFQLGLAQLGKVSLRHPCKRVV